MPGRRAGGAPAPEEQPKPVGQPERKGVTGTGGPRATPKKKKVVVKKTYVAPSPVDLLTPKAPPRPTPPRRRPTPPVSFVGRPTFEQDDPDYPAWGDVRIDPGGGYVVYADGPKDYRRAKREAARSARMLAEGPRLAPLNEESRKRTPVPMSPAERRERELEMAIDAWLDSDDIGAQAVRRSAEKTGAFEDFREWLPGYFVGEYARGERDFDWMTALDAALLPTVVAGPGQGLLAGGLRVAARPFAASRAAGVGVAKAVARKQGLVEATRQSFAGPGYIARGTKSAARGLGAPVRAARPLSNAQAANYAAKKAAAREFMEQKAAFLNIAAWEKRRLALLADQQGQIKLETMLAPVTGGARPLQARKGLERSLGFIGEPAARAAIGRGFENWIDNNRNLLSKLSLGAVRDVESEAGKRIGRQIQFRRQYHLRPAIALKHAQSRLRSSMDYTALRLIGEQTLPEDRIAYHIEQAALDPKNTLYHEVQAQLVSDASKWIENVNGVPQIAEKAPKRLKNLLGLLQQSSEAREAILKELNLLSDEVIRSRINAPGAVVHGAKWVENEVAAQHKLLGSPYRAALREFMVGAGIREGQVDAFFRAVADPAARAHVGLRRTILERELQRALDAPDIDPARVDSLRRALDRVDDEIDAHYQSITEMFYGQPGDAKLYLEDALEAIGPPEMIQADDIAREVLDAGGSLPAHLRDPAVLAQRVRMAYDHFKNGELAGRSLSNENVNPLFGEELPTEYEGLRHAAERMAAHIGWSDEEFVGTAFSGIDNVLDKSAGDNAFDSLMKNGGFTLKSDLSDADLKSGYMVSMGAHETRVATRKTTGESIERFRDEHLDALGESNTYFGGWRNDDDGFVYLDISKHFRNREEALEYAREQGQLAIFDLKTFDDIPTGLAPAQADEIKAGLRPLEERPPEQIAKGFLSPSVPDVLGRRTYTLGLAPYAADAATLAHEWGHFLRYSNIRDYDLRKLSKWAGDDLSAETPRFDTREEWLRWIGTPAGKKRLAAEEKVARGFEVYVMTGGGRGLKSADRDAMEVLSRHIEQAYEVRGPGHKERTFGTAGLQHAWDDLPEPIRDVYDFFLTHEELRGGQFRMEEGVASKAAPGEFYVPYKRGLPVSVRHPFRTARAFVRMRRTLPVGRGAMGAGTDDPNLRHIFKAELLRTGKFDNSQIASASMDQLQRAANLHSLHEVRRALLARDAEGNLIMARSRPERSDDIAVKLNPRKNSDQRLQRVHEYLGQMEAGKKVSLNDLAKEDLEAFEVLAQETFGGVLKGTGLGGRSRKMAELGEIETELGNRAARDVAQDILDGVMDPVENIVWVPRRFLDQLGIFEAPRTLRAENIVSKGIGLGVDVVNDYLRASLLYLNTSYYGMNLVGNAGMNLLHQGVFMPLNLSRAFWISHQMGEETAFIDFLMGRGLMSVAELRSMGDIASGRKISGALGHAAGTLVDMIPRRAAFIHEARRAGYRNVEGIQELLNDPDALYHVVTKAKRAMVDFDELSPFERDVLTRYIFVYPWLKGATMYTLRFPKEHPIQTAALLWLYQKQQDLAEEKIGPRPNYLDLVLPIGTAERYGEKYPLVMNMRQVFTASTPYEIAQNIANFATGNPNGEALSEMLQPWYGNMLTAITGWDPFRHQEVPRGLGTFIESLDPRLAPGVQSVQRVFRSEEERRADAESGKLYPRNRLDDIMHVGLGSIGWTPVNPDTARERAQVGPKSPEQKLIDWAEEVKDLTGQDPDPQMMGIQGNKLRYDEVLSDKRRELKLRDLPEEELTKAKLQVFVELNPEFADQQETWEEQIAATPTKDLDKWDDWLGEQLGWEQFSKYQSYLNKWKQYKEDAGGPQS